MESSVYTQGYHIGVTLEALLIFYELNFQGSY